MLAKTKKPSTRYRVKRVRGPDSSTVTRTGSWRSVRTRRAVTKKLPRNGDKVAAGPGFEPGLSDSESLVLPLHHPARKATRRILPSVSPGVEVIDNLLPPQKPLWLCGSIEDNYRRIEVRRTTRRPFARLRSLSRPLRLGVRPRLRSPLLARS